MVGSILEMKKPRAKETKREKKERIKRRKERNSRSPMMRMIWI